eukprot:TRINITY_DN39602_c0_g1_i1.p1 TRINITY_DN39602_c0_g1~~TRINITY_DN39602_c0_g1_i1.p1  ORF type:complete len:206 (-),score=41.28 TRINITY_DN39602_c0_g1_i1:27-644(-)
MVHKGCLFLTLLTSCHVVQGWRVSAPKDTASASLVLSSLSSRRQSGNVNCTPSRVCCSCHRTVAAEPRSPLLTVARSVALGVLVAILAARAQVALAADLVHGEAVFDANCVSCHAGGSNKIYPLQNLSKQALERNNKYGVEQIVKQVTYGQAPMPAFASKLDAKSIEDVASFVYAEADVNWKDKKLVGGQARRFSQFLDSLSPFN